MYNRLFFPYEFQVRWPLEYDTNYVQPIPYIVFVSKQNGKVLGYRRHSDEVRNNESRLYGKRSIGVGGHVEQHELGEDDLVDPFRSTALREIEEELGLVLPDSDLIYKGIVFIDLADHVEYFHIGIVFQVIIDEDKITQAGEFDTKMFLWVDELQWSIEKNNIELELRSQCLLDRL